MKKTCTRPAEMSGGENRTKNPMEECSLSLAIESKPGKMPGLLTCCTEIRACYSLIVFLFHKKQKTGKDGL